MTLKGDKVKYCLELPRPLHEQVRALAQRKHYPMAAIFRDGAALILDREGWNEALPTTGREEAAK